MHNSTNLFENSVTKTRVICLVIKYYCIVIIVRYTVLVFKNYSLIFRGSSSLYYPRNSFCATARSRER